MQSIALEEPTLIQEVYLLAPDERAAQAFLAEAVRRHLAAYRQKQIAAETDAWYRLPTAERERYTGAFVAVYQGQVIDSDPDRLTLYYRVRARLGRRPVLITAGGDYPLPVYTVRSPRRGAARLTCGVIREA